MRSCNRLVNAVRKVYGDSFGMMFDSEKQEEDKSDLKKEKKNKKDNITLLFKTLVAMRCLLLGFDVFSSIQTVINFKSFQILLDLIITAPSSPLRRKASMAHIDKLERPSDVPHLAAFRHRRKRITTTRKKKQDKEKFKEDLPVLKYIKAQVKSLFHCNISAIIKGAVVMPEELFTEILTVTWELLLEWDYQLTASAAVAFILASVKAPEFATHLLAQELKHDEPARRINAILKFQVLWRNRYQCWPRMEDGAHITFKVPPPNIEFTLPSPKIASDHVPVADTPWMPHVKAKVEEVTINQEQTVSSISMNVL
ncbi:protein unc-80 homolog [Caerostris extrusa]|uniref:Protein unc-80 homolog n=1 Tax=Caerostris extrusa TaxID=172846 RepID=A0AAV4PQ29_CAEEX|nr:protein unc-80 homolog [Caerostris extrusa]